MVLTDDPYEYIIVRRQASSDRDLAGDARADGHHLEPSPRRSVARAGASGMPSRRPKRPTRSAKSHDFLTVGAPAPLQAAAAVGYAFDAEYFNHLARDYRVRRDLMAQSLSAAGFKFTLPEGAYYILADFRT